MVYSCVEEINFTLQELSSTPMPQKVLMANPKYFDVEYVINPHMQGHIGSVDSAKALQQWNTLKLAYEEIGIESHVIEGVPGFPDMVFCANQSLPCYHISEGKHITEGKHGVVLSNMHAAQRKGEVAFFAGFFNKQGYAIYNVDSDNGSDFEGMGDAVWHPNFTLLWGGYGYRTHCDIYEEIAQLLNVRILTLELSDPDFYHLDTCFCVLDAETVLIYPGAFSGEGLALIRHFFTHVIESPENEARSLFSCNAHCPDQHHIIIQQGCTDTVAKLKDAGFHPIEVDTSEFLKSGGSVFCMKQMFW